MGGTNTVDSTILPPPDIIRADPTPAPTFGTYVLGACECKTYASESLKDDHHLCVDDQYDCFPILATKNDANLLETACVLPGQEIDGQNGEKLCRNFGTTDINLVHNTGASNNQNLGELADSHLNNENGGPAGTELPG